VRTGGEDMFKREWNEEEGKIREKMRREKERREE
jgi:hypothetical protein